MAFEEILVSISGEAGQDLSAKQYYAVTRAAGDGQYDPTGDGLRADGVLQNKPDAAGKAATIAVSGITKMVAGAAITNADKVTADSSGKARTATTGNQILGIAQEAALADGDIIAVRLMLTPEATA